MEVYISTGRSSICTRHEHIQTEKGLCVARQMYIYAWSLLCTLHTVFTEAAASEDSNVWPSSPLEASGD